MKPRKDQWLVCILFCGFLGCMMLLYLCLPKADFSQQEKRYLAEAPQLTWESLSSGEFSADVDTFMADHIPGRSFFVGLNAYYDLLTGRQPSKDILLADNHRLVEAPVTRNDTAISKNMEIINRFAESSPVAVDLMIVPSAGWASRSHIQGLHDAYEDGALIADIYAQAGSNVRTVDVVSAFDSAPEPEALYYKTDHHWTSLGAWTACRSYMEMLGRTYISRENYRIESISGFRGSTYTRSALWLTPAEDLELWHSGAPITVTHEESTEPNEGVFFRERLAEADKYTVYLDGNHALVRLESPEAEGGKLLVIRDSYSNCLGAFLADSYETVVLADLRYYRQPLSELMAQEDFDQVLICYSIGNFLTDTNMIWLR